MPQFWSSEFWRIALNVASFWLLGLILGFPLWGIVAGLLSYLFFLARRFVKFAQWVNTGLSEPEEFGGIFEELSFRIYRIRTRSRKRKKKLSELLRRWQDSSGVLPDATVVISQDGHIVWFNQTASSMLGLKQSDQGQHIGNLVRNPQFIHYITLGDHSEHLEIASPLDSSKILSIRVTPYGSQQRLLMVSDVTHIQRLMTMRRDFIANVSHELRTPLTVIMGYLETLKDDQDCDEALLREYLGKIEIPAQRMKTLVEDLLLLSKLDTGTPSSPDSCSVINIATMVKNISAEAEQISKGRHHIHINIDENIRIKGIEKEIYSAFINLVTNAIRYTPESGEITLGWSRFGDAARFCVKDTGTGIAVEHIPRLTERFYRIDVGRSRSVGGTGLGLAIVKQVLRRHDAELQINTQKGKGSEFCCLFPQARLVFHDKHDAQSTRAISNM
ncbi:MAG: phosphate regulon sensor histidine kinase PhoR [Gammaproteobacteria bacterium]|nr:phosphate regulon sensor histidine kinase PhoR [Gammaproteobacteria bacterium]